MNNQKIMKLIKYLNYHFILILVLLLTTGLGNLPDKNKIAHWSFSETNGLFVHEDLSMTKAVIHSSFPNPEFVEGIKNTGLRLNSYSSFVEGKIPIEFNQNYTIEGWFSLESYPMETAGFISLDDPSRDEGIMIGVTNFGFPCLGWGKTGQIEYVIDENPVERFEWIHMVFTMQDEYGSLFINGNVVLENIPISLDFNPTRYIFGNHFDPIKSNSIGYFTILNGIIDEISIYNEPLNEKNVKNIYDKNLPETSPDLSIPIVRFQDDFLRPRYHLQPAANWTNESHGLIYYNGRYHIFNQKNASGLNLRQMNWGHFSSDNLVTWTEHRPVLSPEPGYDQHGIWSGHAVIDDNNQPVIFYSSSDGTSPYNVSIAFPEDEDLIDWEKYEDNPVIHEVPENFTRTDMRDPYIWKDGDKWYLTIGYGIEDNETQKGAVLLYSSEDLINWEYIHPLFVGKPDIDDSGIFWEMPIFWEFEKDEYILLVNKVPERRGDTRIPANALYWVGSFKNEKFIPKHEVPRKLEVINKFLSPSIAYDTEGRVITIGIIPVYGHGKSTYERGWTHIFSIPRVWSLKDGIIHQKPHPNLKSLRDKEHKYENISVSSYDNKQMEVRGHQLEIIAKINPMESDQFGFVIAKNPDGTEKTKIYYDFENQQFVVDASQSSVYSIGDTNNTSQIRDYSQFGDYDLDRNEKVNIHIFIDGAVIEVFVNDRDAFTATILPSKKESNLITLYSNGGTALFESVTVYELKSSDNKVDY